MLYNSRGFVIYIKYRLQNTAFKKIEIQAKKIIYFGLIDEDAGLCLITYHKDTQKITGFSMTTSIGLEFTDLSESDAHTLYNAAVVATAGYEQWKCTKNHANIIFKRLK